MGMKFTVLDLHALDQNPKATCLDRWNGMCGYNPRQGGVTLPPPPKLCWDYWQGGVAERRRDAAIERVERERLRRETGIEVFAAIPLKEFAT